MIVGTAPFLFKTITLMSSQNDTPPSTTDASEVFAPLSEAPPEKTLSEAAKRALAEAEERRQAQVQADTLALEQGGPEGLEPTRFGDWERKGIAVDF